MGNALFVDISSFQDPARVNWAAYKAWSAQGDGISRALLRSDQGVGVKDSAFEQFWAAAVAVGIDELYLYHYAYPNLHPGTSGAVSEAQSMEATIGGRLRPRDRVMLDLEQNEDSTWAMAFGQELARWHPTASKPVIYDSLSHIQQFLQDPALQVVFDLALADWTFDPSSRPAAPAPWSHYVWLQFSDRLAVPGMPGIVDANVFLGGTMGIPSGWTDDGKILTAPNGITITTGFRGFILSHAWDAANVPLGPEHESDPASTAEPQLGNGTRMDFVYNSLIWSRAQGTIKLAALNAELALLKQQTADPLATAAKAALKAWLA
jgi:GH25 family lysozyme M1 (1,4-beta-N-acetylmuramidase)